MYEHCYHCILTVTVLKLYRPVPVGVGNLHVHQAGIRKQRKPQVVFMKWRLRLSTVNYPLLKTGFTGTYMYSEVQVLDSVLGMLG